MQRETNSYNSAGHASPKVTYQSTGDPSSSVTTGIDDTLISLTSNLKLLLIISGLLCIATSIVIIIIQMYGVILAGTSLLASTILNIIQMIYLLVDGIKMISAARKLSYGIKSLRKFFTTSLALGILGSISMGIVLVIMSSACSSCDVHNFIKLSYVALILSIFLTVYSIPCLLYVRGKQTQLLAYNNIA